METTSATPIDDTPPTVEVNGVECVAIAYTEAVQRLSLELYGDGENARSLCAPCPRSWHRNPSHGSCPNCLIPQDINSPGRILVEPGFYAILKLRKE